MIDHLSPQDIASSDSSIAGAEIAEMFRQILKKAITQQDISPAELAVRAGIPKSTLSMIISGKNDRLPSLLNCLKLARALALDIGDFFPQVRAHETSLGGLNRAFLNPQKISPTKVFELLQRMQPWTSAYWCLTNIPDFCKSPEFLAIEKGISPTAAAAQIEQESMFNRVNYQNTSGIMILRKSILSDLIERRNSFAAVSGVSALKMLENLKQFAENCSDQAKIIVSNETTQNVDPILIMNDRIAITYPFGSYFVSTDKAMIGFIQEHFNLLAQTSPSFSEWYRDTIG